LSASQKGALYEYMVIDPDDDTNEYAKVTLTYENKGGKYPISSFFTGNVEGQKQTITLLQFSTLLFEWFAR